MNIAPKQFFGYRPYLKEEIKPILSIVQNYARKGDAIYVYYGAVPAFEYYEKKFNLDKYAIVKGISSRGDWEKYKEDLSQLKNFKRVWIIFSHIHVIENDTEERYIIKYFGTVSEKQKAAHGINASAYLYQTVDNSK